MFLYSLLYGGKNQDQKKRLCVIVLILQNKTRRRDYEFMFLIILLVRAASSALLVPMQYELVLVPRLPTESVVLCKMYFTRLNSMEDLLNLKVVGGCPPVYYIAEGPPTPLLVLLLHT